MSDLNMVCLIGRLTRDAELKYTTSGTAVCKFSIAVNRKKKEGDNWVDEASFFDVVLWGRQGEALNQYLQKGKQIGVDGELRQERWEQQDGQKRSRIEVVADNIQLLGGGNGSGESGGGGNTGSGRSGNSYGDSKNGPSGSGSSKDHTRENDDGFTDDIPF